MQTPDPPLGTTCAHVCCLLWSVTRPHATKVPVTRSETQSSDQAQRQLFCVWRGPQTCALHERLPVWFPLSAHRTAELTLTQVHTALGTWGLCTESASWSQRSSRERRDSGPPRPAAVCTSVRSLGGHWGSTCGLSGNACTANPAAGEEHQEPEGPAPAQTLTHTSCPPGAE